VSNYTVLTLYKRSFDLAGAYYFSNELHKKKQATNNSEQLNYNMFMSSKIMAKCCWCFGLHDLLLAPKL
jgi:hypothetical protein